MISFSFEEANSILRNAPVRAKLERRYHINSKDFDVNGYSRDGSIMYIDRRLPMWRFIGNDIPVKRFIVLRLHVEKSVRDALRYSGGLELERLLTLMKMEKLHSPADILLHANAVATTCEEYKVLLAHGESGAKYYFEFLAAQKRAEKVPEDLDVGG